MTTGYPMREVGRGLAFPEGPIALDDGRDGQVRVEIAVPEPDPFVTNICFGGRDQRQAFITSSGRGKLYQADWPFPGLRLHFAR